MAVDLATEDIPAPDPRTSRRLYRTGSFALVIAIAAMAFRSDLPDPLLLVAACIIFILAAVPALNWARKAEPHFPVFEMFMLTAIPFYALPLIQGRRETLQFSTPAIWQAVAATIVFQLTAIATFSRTRGHTARARSLVVSLLPPAALRLAQTGIWLNTIYLYIVTFTDLIPREFATPVRAIFFGLGTVSLFVEMRRWGARDLKQTECFVIIFNVTVQLIFLFTQLYLIDGISTLLLALIGYVSSSRRLPIAPIVLILPVIAVLHSGKSAMRDKYWVGAHVSPGITDLPGFFSEWIGHGLTPRPADDPSDTESLAGRLFERASLFQMLCLVTERTPNPFPYLSGESYRYLPAQLIPSLLWPDKPSSLLSNTLLAVHYRLVPEDNTFTVSIAFGMIAESYANFGLIGCALLGVVLGFGYKRLSQAAVGCPQFSAIGLFTILLAAWSFQVEQIFASWVVSLIQAAIVVIGVPLAFRRLFGAV
jgi:hypothetical protein